MYVYIYIIFLIGIINFYNCTTTGIYKLTIIKIYLYDMCIKYIYNLYSNNIKIYMYR